jgi:hypothetical protein
MSAMLNHSRTDATPERFLALWNIGHDTASIAKICRVSEAKVYNAAPWLGRKPSFGKIRYAGAT